VTRGWVEDRPRRGEIGGGMLRAGRRRAPLGYASHTRKERDLGLRCRIAHEMRAVRTHGELHALGSAETRATLLDGEHAPSAGLAIEHEVRTAHLREHAVETALLREALGLDHQHQGLGTECANERAIPSWSAAIHDLGGDRGEGSMITDRLGASARSASTSDRRPRTH
jgi:hypothetical protein